MPYSPADLHKNTRAALDSKFKAVSQLIDERIRSQYNGKSPAHVMINAEAAWVEPLLFDVIKSNYAAYGWSVETKIEYGDQRDPYTNHYLVFKEAPKNSVCGGMGYGENDR